MMDVFWKVPLHVRRFSVGMAHLRPIPGSPTIAAIIIAIAFFLYIFGVMGFGWHLTAVVICVAVLWWLPRVPMAAVVRAMMVALPALVLAPFVGRHRPLLRPLAIRNAARVMLRHTMAPVYAAMPEPANYRVADSQQFPEFKVLTQQLSNLGAKSIRGDLNPQRRFKLLLELW